MLVTIDHAHSDSSSRVADEESTTKDIYYYETLLHSSECDIGDISLAGYIFTLTRVINTRKSSL